jgi:hypothetical protein
MFVYNIDNYFVRLPEYDYDYDDDGDGDLLDTGAFVNRGLVSILQNFFSVNEGGTK